MRESEPLTASGVAKILGCSERTVLRMVERGDLSARKLPWQTGPFLFDPDEVERYREKLAAEAAEKAAELAEQRSA